MRDAYDRSLARQRAADRARHALYAQDKGATIDETMANAHDRLHPEEAPPEQRWRTAVLAPPDAESAAITGGAGNAVLIGDDVSDTLLDPYSPKYADPFYEGIAGKESGGRGYVRATTSCQTGRRQSHPPNGHGAAMA